MFKSYALLKLYFEVQLLFFILWAVVSMTVESCFNWDSKMNMKINLALLQCSCDKIIAVFGRMWAGESS